MPRSSRHKSHRESKRSSRDDRDFSDSEKDSSLKDRKAREGTIARVSKDLGSGEKRKPSQDGKDVFGSGNDEFPEEYSASKRRKDKADEVLSDRWNGGRGDRVEGSQSKASIESKSRHSKRQDGLSERKDEDVDREEAKKNGGKVESKHKVDRDSSRKEGRNANDKEGGSERDRKGKEVKTERLVGDGTRTDAVAREATKKQGLQSGGFEEEHGVKKLKKVAEISVDVQDELRNRELEGKLERQVRRRKDSSGDRDKCQDGIRDGKDRQLFSRDDIAKDGRYTDVRKMDEGYRDKYHEEIDGDGHLDDRKRNERPARDCSSSRSVDRHTRNEKNNIQIRDKKSKPQDSDRECDLDCDRDRDRDYDHFRDRNRDHNHDREPDRDRDCGCDRERDCNRNRDYDHSLHPDERNTRYKDDSGRKRSPDGHDDHYKTKSRSIKLHCPEVDRKYLSTSKVDSGPNRGRYQSRQAHVDTILSGYRWRSSPSSSSHVGTDKYRHSKQEDSKYGDSLLEQRPNATSTREVPGVSGALDRVSKYQSMEKPIKMDENHLGELSAEKSSSSKASPMGLMERSPSLTSVDRRYMKRSGVRRSLDVEETERRSSGSNDARDSSVNEDRLSRDFPSKKHLADESSQADSFFYTRTYVGKSSSLIPAPAAFRAGLDSAVFLGSSEEDGRSNSSTRFRRSVDPNVGRGHAWKNVSNWSSPVSNGFIPFQHGPPPGGFHAMMRQFPSPPLFGVRPSMEINHSGIPFHIHDSDRFSGHLRPLGWQNMVDGPGPSQSHGWDGNNGVYGDDHPLYGGAEWDQNRHPMNNREWHMTADMWKGQNGRVNRDSTFSTQKEEYPMQAQADEILAGQAGPRSQNGSNNDGVESSVEMKGDSGTSLAEETSKASPETTNTGAPDVSQISGGCDVSHFCHIYLSKLDISTELACPELYNQCMSSLDMEQSVIVDEETTKDANLEDGTRGGLKVPDTRSSPSIFPVIKDFVFERAMELYKKQSIKMGCMKKSNGESVSNQKKLEGEVPIDSKEKAEEPVLCSDEEMPKEIFLTSIQRNAEHAVSTAGQEKLEKLVPIPSLELQELIQTQSSSAEVLVQACCHENPQEPIPVSIWENMDGMSSKQEKSEDANEVGILPSDKASQTATISPTNGDNMSWASMTEGNHSACSAEEWQVFRVVKTGPLFFSDGSPKACEALMLGSNESESVILSRIHHSPESTH